MTAGSCEQAELVQAAQCLPALSRATQEDPAVKHEDCQVLHPCRLSRAVEIVVAVQACAAPDFCLLLVGGHQEVHGAVWRWPLVCEPIARFWGPCLLSRSGLQVHGELECCRLGHLHLRR